ncbi:2Fe-2S iron-sulfur cluster-binding protein [Desulfofundulus thermosubterraneus]|uniref:Ferredoxin n=1 Tax=Desulfofundulus thermosubterraneus DSM 16057 TaxID=1121432 RepID=A0A1M6G4D0_9FIRM|nr:2Fe-2S iron-sulfur cluster-binding protein [Desulfofundulus thermosubterraneus]SHJ04667.1 NADH-quinone oxidoreductase subunit G [Desulfofundulus thermosubterraneus DSM 16057]
MKTVTLTIDGRTVQAREGEKLLWAALENGIYIPNLCAIPGVKHPAAACRLCFVEIRGYPRPVTACTEPVVEGMVVSTRSPRVDRLVHTAFELLLSNHHLDCASCPRNRSCELQRIARERRFPLRVKRLRKLERNLQVDDSSPVVRYDPGKCVLCGRCVWVCREKGTGVLGFAGRGFERRIATFGDVPLGQSGCNGCGECTRVCPVGALTGKEA